MISTNTRRSALALLATAGLLAGCGGDDSKDNAAVPATNPAGTTAEVAATTPIPTPDEKAKKELASPTGKWATSVCNGLAKNSLEVQPPNVNPADPGSTRDSLIGFFDSVSKQLNGQVKVLQDAGDPPAGRKTYNKAIDKLEQIEERVSALGSKVKKSDATSEKDISLIVADLGKDMTDLSGYGGPIVDLTKNSDLKRVLAAEPACANFL